MWFTQVEFGFEISNLGGYARSKLGLARFRVNNIAVKQPDRPRPGSAGGQGLAIFSESESQRGDRGNTCHYNASLMG
jgi:hypothetical protein